MTKLASMTLEALIKLRNDVGAAINQRATALKRELSAIGEDYARVGRIAVYGKKRVLQAKYRDTNGNTWVGRGAQPRWLTDAVKKGAKREDFLIDKAAKTKKPAKRARKKKAS